MFYRLHNYVVMSTFPYFGDLNNLKMGLFLKFGTYTFGGGNGTDTNQNVRLIMTNK